jgi:hypothetical protein
MSEKSKVNTEKTNGNAKRGNRLITTVSSHMVNHPIGLQAVRPERIRQSLLNACPAYRARTAA